MCRQIHACYFKSHNIRSYSVNPALFVSDLVKNFVGVNEGVEGKTAEEVAKDEAKTAVLDGAAALFNPIYPNKTGNPKHIGNFMSAVMDGSTLWPSGAAVCIDNDCKSIFLLGFLSFFLSFHHRAVRSSWTHGASCWPVSMFACLCLRVCACLRACLCARLVSCGCVARGVLICAILCPSKKHRYFFARRTKQTSPPFSRRGKRPQVVRRRRCQRA